MSDISQEAPAADTDQDSSPAPDSDIGSDPSITTLYVARPPCTSDTLPAARTSPESDVLHFGDTPIVVHHRRNRHQSEQYARRNKRYLTARNLSVLSVVQMEHRKSGVLHSDDFKRALRTRTYDSMLSGSTCVSESDSLPVHVEPTGDHRLSGLRRMLVLFRRRSGDEASDTRSSYRVVHWISGLVPAAWTIG